MEDVIAQIRDRIGVLLREKGRVLIAIDGSCTSGKSTLADRLEKEWDCNVFHMDDFFLRPQQRKPERLAMPGGNVDYERFQEEVLLPLKQGTAFFYYPYDCSTSNLAGPVEVEPKQINIIEGSYSQHPYFGDVYDLKVFLQVAPEIREQRIGMRPAFLQKRFCEEWIPMEQQYFEAFSVAERADMIALPADNR